MHCDIIKFGIVMLSQVINYVVKLSRKPMKIDVCDNFRTGISNFPLSSLVFNSNVLLIYFSFPPSACFTGASLGV